VSGSPGLAVLRRLRQPPTRSVDDELSPTSTRWLRISCRQSRRPSRVHLLFAHRRRHPAICLRHPPTTTP